MLKEVLAGDLVRDCGFFQLNRRGLSPETCTALNGFWARSEFSEISSELQLPHLKWEQIVECLLALLDGRVVGSYEDWAKIARASQEVATSDPFAASIIALYAVARWEGGLGNKLFNERWRHAPYGLNAGWYVFPLIAAQNLLKADAIWASRRLARTAVETIENSSSWNRLGRDPEITGAYREALSGSDRRFAECVGNLSWDLHESCRFEQPNFRPEVAALFWSLGDVPHADLIRETTILPSRQAITRLVQRSLQVIHLDPAVQRIWLRLRDRPPFSVRAHRELFVSINMVWGGRPFHDVQRGESVSQHTADSLSLSEVPPSEAYAQAIIEYFQGEVSTQTLALLAETYTASQPILEAFAPEALHRLHSLIVLINDPSKLGSGKQSRAQLWQSLAQNSCDIVEAREQDMRDSYDRTLDIPFYYLERDSLAMLAQTIELTERYRAAAQWYWRHVIPPSVGAEHPEVQRLRAEEDTLISELRGNLILRLLPFLPSGYGRRLLLKNADTDPAFKAGPGLDVLAKDARDDARTLGRKLEDVASQLAEIDAEYKAGRSTTNIRIDEFAAALIPKRTTLSG